MTAKDADPKLPGYTIIRKDRPQPKEKEKNRGGGLLTAIKAKRGLGYKSIDMQIKASDDSITESQTIEIPTGDGHNLRLTNVYIPPVRVNTAQEDAITLDNWPHESNDLILGDMNAHSPIWENSYNSNTIDARGKKFERWMDSSGMAALNSGTHTYNCRRPGSTSQSAPDLSFASPALMDKLEWETVNDLSSDHLPIIITYDTTTPEVNAILIYKYKLDKADWKAYTEQIKKNLPKL
jgi:hypothetical protein